MAAEETTTPVETKPTKATAEVAKGGTASEKRPVRGGRGGGRGEPHQRRRRVARRQDRARSELDQKIVSIRRVTRVVAGGRRFNFSVAMIVGDRKGSVGVGTGKAGDTSLAIEKAVRDAKKHMVKIKITKDSRIPHDVEAKYAASVVWISPAPGRGLVAGGAARTVLDLAGVRDATAKILSRSKNHLNNARAVIKALEKLQD
ncbi:MAG TPA: 30S ribosomal protein S5 [Candidatus Paceibacterota bacterium]|jgi:small subunit ribosomal protein S5